MHGRLDEWTHTEIEVLEVVEMVSEKTLVGQW